MWITYRISTRCVKLNTAPTCYVACIIGFSKGAITESRPSNALYALRNSDRVEGRATSESFLSNACYAIANGNGGQGRTIPESTLSNTLYAIGDCDGAQGGTLLESTISNANDTIRDNKRCECRTLHERSSANQSSIFFNIVCTRDSVSGLNEAFVNIQPVIFPVGIVIIDSCSLKCKGSNTHYTIRDGDGNKGIASIKSPLSNARNTIRNGDGGNGGATLKSIISNAGNCIGDHSRCYHWSATDHCIIADK